MEDPTEEPQDRSQSKMDKPTAPELGPADESEEADDISQPPEQDSTPLPDAEEPTTEAETKNAGEETETPDDYPDKSQVVVGGKPKWYKRLGYWYADRRRWSVPLTLLIIIGVLAAVPFTRFALAGLVLRQNFLVTVDDSVTHTPVSKVAVTLDGQRAETDSAGQVKLRVHVGHRQLTLNKKYYQANNQKVLVPLNDKGRVTVELTATGRQVPVTVTDRLTGKPLDGVVISAAGTDAKTNQQGEATIVLPTGKAQLSAILTAKGFNDTKTQLTVTGQDVPANHLAMTPSGQVYFLSRLSGKIDVVKTNLDGTDRQTVLAGTGYEDKQNTMLMASPDWRYLALLAQRKPQDGGKLYLISTSNDAVSVIDDGDAGYMPIGWSGENFIYQANSPGVADWQPHAESLKTFNAGTAKLSVIDQTDGSGTSESDYYDNYFGQVEILGGRVIYYRNLESSGVLTGKTLDLISVKPDGSDKMVIKSFPASPSNSFVLDVSQYSPDGMYVGVPLSNGSNGYYDFSGGKLTADGSVTDSQFSNDWPIYLLSPDGKQTFWSEKRDGKYSLFLGDASGQHAQQVVSLSDYQAYGWYGNYLLVSKGGNELYSLSPDGKIATKISDYYDQGGNGYGYDYSAN